MRKKLVFVTLVLGIGLVSCQKEAVDDGERMVDVVATTSVAKVSTKAEVTSGGATNWSVDDQVFVVDVSGKAEVFTNSLVAPSAVGKFSGKLLAGRKEQMYYAYHSASNSVCTSDKFLLTVNREDLKIHVADKLSAIQQGHYCSMVAEPIKFDAEVAASIKSFNFHHLGCLIEARISSTNGMGDVVFDKVVFSVTAIDAIPGYEDYNSPTPFNTQITLNMKKLKGTPEIEIPFGEDGPKTKVISSTITYENAIKLSDGYTSGTTHFDIPIYALPTKAKFTYQYDIVFFNRGEKVLHLRKQGIADGLKLSGLNDPSFTEANAI